MWLTTAAARAQTCFRRVCTANSFQVANFLFRQEHYISALPHYEEAARERMYPEYKDRLALVIANRSLCYLRIGNGVSNARSAYELALRDAEVAVMLAPENAAFHLRKLNAVEKVHGKYGPAFRVDASARPLRAACICTHLRSPLDTH